MSNNDAFEDLARFAMERAVAYRQVSDSISVRPIASVQELRSLFDVGLPQQGRGGIEVLSALADAAEQGLVGNTRPNFFGWVMGASIVRAWHRVENTWKCNWSMQKARSKIISGEHHHE